MTQLDKQKHEHTIQRTKETNNKYENKWTLTSNKRISNKNNNEMSVHL